MSEWVYIESERTSEYVLYTVGFYGPNDKWQPDSDHSNREAAAERVSFLNGNAQPAASVAPPWQPIETIPALKNVLLAGIGNSDVYEGYYDPEREEYYLANTHHTDAYDGRVYPTHWMQLPEPPMLASAQPAKGN